MAISQLSIKIQGTWEPSLWVDIYIHKSQKPYGALLWNNRDVTCYLFSISLMSSIVSIHLDSFSLFSFYFTMTCNCFLIYSLVDCPSREICISLSAGATHKKNNHYIIWDFYKLLLFSLLATLDSATASQADSQFDSYLCFRHLGWNYGWVRDVCACSMETCPGCIPWRQTPADTPLGIKWKRSWTN